MNFFNCSYARKLRGLLLLPLLLLGLGLLAQTPQAFKYQAVVRDVNGEPLGLANVSVRLSILSGNINGPTVYSEIHSLMTSSGGLITLDMGSGTPGTGSFEDIIWGLANYFVKIEVDAAGGTNFAFMGTSQLLSVPYALYAKEAEGPASYTWDQLLEYLQDRSGPAPGMMIFVKDEGKLVYYNGEQWVTTNEECFPPPSVVSAGVDQVDVAGTITFLSAEVPKFGVGQWSIISEANGDILSISDIYNPEAELSTTGGNFVLQWTVTNECGESFDQVSINFCPPNTLAVAGESQSDIIGNTAQLSANQPEIGNTGTWSVINGNGYSFEDVNNPNTVFTGTPGMAYTLRWTMATGCDSNFHEIEIGFCYTLTIAEAGQDQINIPGTQTTLSGNIPGDGNSGVWSVISGDNGGILNPGQYNSEFNGMPNETYVLRWTISSDCQVSYDEVTIYFCPILTIANAGPDQLDMPGSNVQLAANEPGIANSGLWKIEDDIGGKSVIGFSDPEDPHTTFTGEPGLTYLLSWTISTVCNTSVDYMTLSFCPLLPVADAGTDALNVCIPHDLNGNDPGEGNTGEWTVITGQGYSFSSVNNPTAAFSGSPGATYELVWTIANACGSSNDTVTVTFDPFPTTANAGQNQTNVEGTTLTLAANIPSVGFGLWSILSGEGGSFADSAYHATEFYGQIGEAYELEWRISTNCYTSADTLNISFVAVFMCGDNLVDERDLQVYPTVQIGDQCWMAKNLNVGTQIFSGGSPTNNGIIEKYCYDNQPANCQAYGGLYFWNEAMNYTTVEGAKGICPDGWRIPTDNEWQMLFSYAGDSVSCKLRTVGSLYWDDNECATDVFGFDARGAGQIFSNTNYLSIKTATHFWTSTPSTSDRSWKYALYNHQIDVSKTSYIRNHGLSVRCIKLNQ